MCVCVCGVGREALLWESNHTAPSRHVTEPSLGLLCPHWGKPGRNRVHQGWGTEEYGQLPSAQEVGSPWDAAPQVKLCVLGDEGPIH